MSLLQNAPSPVSGEEHEGRRQLELGALIGQSLTSRAPLSAQLQQCAQAVVTTLDTAFARIWTASDAGDVLELKASAGMYTHLDGPHARVPVGSYKIGLIAAERAAHLTNDVLDDPRVSNQEWARREGMVSFAGYPLVVEDRLIGVIAAFARRPLGPSTLKSLASVADMIAVGIDRARRERERLVLLRREQHRVATMAALARASLAINSAGTLDEILAETAAAGREVVGATGAVVTVRPPDARRAASPVDAHPPDGHEGRLAVPLVGRDGVEIGALVAWGREAPFGEEDETAAIQLARLAAVAIENARLTARAREDSETFATIARVGRTLSAELNLESVVQAVTDAATELSRAQFGAFFYNVVGDRGEAYTLYTISGVPREHFSKFPMPRNTAVFAPTFAGEDVVRLEDVRKDPRFGKNDPHRGMPEGHLPVVSYLAVPVISRSGKVLGGLFFGHEEAGVFDERAEKLVVGLAAQAAVAVDNAALFQQVTRARAELHALNDTLEERVRTRTAELEAANGELEAFSYSVSHDLRAPIRHIAGFTDLLAREIAGKVSPVADRQVHIIAEAAQRAGMLVDDLLSFSRMGRTELNTTAVPLARLVEQARAELAPDTMNREIIWDVGELPSVDVDPALFSLVLKNLLGNAVKFTRGRPVARISVQAKATGDEHVIAVADNGAGFDPRYSHKLFGVFQRLHTDKQYEGTGIGLANVRRIVQRHGGRVWAEGAIDEGATFHVALPRKEIR